MKPLKYEKIDRRPKRSGYLKKWRHSIELMDYGVPGECIDWCKKKSKGKWGWYFMTNKEVEFDWQWDPTDARAFVSFQYKKDATRFWWWYQTKWSEFAQSK